MSPEAKAVSKANKIIADTMVDEIDKLVLKALELDKELGEDKAKLALGYGVKIVDKLPDGLTDFEEYS